MQQRRRSKPHSFEAQLAAEKTGLRAKLANVPRGPETDMLVKKIGQLEPLPTSMNGSSPGLQPPRR
jgi:hypothetical protein